MRNAGSSKRGPTGLLERLLQLLAHAPATAPWRAAEMRLPLRSGRSGHRQVHMQVSAQHAHTRSDTRRHAQTRTGHARRSGVHVVCAYLHHSSTPPYAVWAPTAAAPPPGMGSARSAEAARKLCKDFSHGGRSHFSGDVEFTMLTFGAKWVRGGHGNEGSVWAMELLRVERRYLGLHQHK